jgi:hypothetical protein
MKQNSHRSGSAWLLSTVLITSTSLAAEHSQPPPPPPAPDAAVLHEQVAAEVAQHATGIARHAQEIGHQAIVMAHARSAGVDVDIDLPEAPEPPEPPDLSHLETRLATIVGDPFGGEGGASAPLLVATGLDGEQRSQLTEDLKVMQRLLEKAADRAGAGGGADTAMGIAVWNSYSFGRPAPRTLYLDGYGAVFMLNVKYPLVAPPTKEPAKEDADKPDNSAWEETRRELYGHRDERRSPGMDPLLAARYGLGTTTKERGAQFSAAKVEALKKFLIEAAKNASNIRKLEADEQIVIVAQGPATPMLKNVEVNRRDAQERVVVTARGGGPQTTLMMRFKKADAEAFANGKLSTDEFSRKVEIAAY